MNPRTRCILAMLALAQGCRDWTKPVIPPDPELVALPKDAETPTREALHAQASDRSRQGDARAALRTLQRALATHPGDPETEFLMAREYLAVGEQTSALEFAGLAATHDPTPVRIRACAPIMVAAGAPQRAARLIESVLPSTAAGPERSAALRELVLARSAAGEHDGAVASARELAAEDPGAGSQAVLGEALLRAGLLADAEEAFRAGTALDARSTPCWNGLGTAALNRWIAGGKADASARDRAVAAFEASLAIDREQPRVVRLMASYGL